MAELKCPHCGMQPDKAIEGALDTCSPGDAFEALTNCDHCRGEISIAVHKEAIVQRRGVGYSDAELDYAATFGG